MQHSVCHLFLSQTRVSLESYAVGCGGVRYVSVMGNHVVNPVITPSGLSGTITGILAAGLVGPDYHLSPVWTPINMQLGAIPRIPSFAEDSLISFKHHLSKCPLEKGKAATQWM